MRESAAFRTGSFPGFYWVLMLMLVRHKHEAVVFCEQLGPGQTQDAGTTVPLLTKLL